MKHKIAIGVGLGLLLFLGYRAYAAAHRCDCLKTPDNPCAGDKVDCFKSTLDVNESAPIVLDGKCIKNGVFVDAKICKDAGLDVTQGAGAVPDGAGFFNIDELRGFLE
jgi:hypothetical protein